MATSMEELRVLQLAERVADSLWKEVIGWNAFAREVVGGQMARAADSVGANIAESFGRFNFGEKIQFLYYSRGSLFETKYWLNRSAQRELLSRESAQMYSDQLTDVAKQINIFAKSYKTQKNTTRQQGYGVREERETYETNSNEELFSDEELNGLSKPVNL